MEEGLEQQVVVGRLVRARGLWWGLVPWLWLLLVGELAHECSIRKCRSIRASSLGSDALLLWLLTKSNYSHPRNPFHHIPTVSYYTASQSLEIRFLTAVFAPD